MDLDGARVIVTGASTGIGRVTALRLAGQGARVWAAARDERRLESLAAEHPGITAVPADVADDADRATLVKQCDPVDVLVNNAGIGWKGVVEAMPPDKVRELFDVNVLALIDLTQRVLPGMLERHHGHVVNVGSIAGYVSAPGETVYCATKFAVQGFTDGLRREVVRRGVDVTLIAPGPIKTEFMARIRTGEPAGEPGALGTRSRTRHRPCHPRPGAQGAGRVEVGTRCPYGDVKTRKALTTSGATAGRSTATRPGTRTAGRRPSGARPGRARLRTPAATAADSRRPRRAPRRRGRARPLLVTVRSRRPPGRRNPRTTGRQRGRTASPAAPGRSPSPRRGGCGCRPRPHRSRTRRGGVAGHRARA